MAVDEDALENLRDDDHNPAGGSLHAALSLRDFGLSTQGPEDDEWLMAANRPVFFVNLAPASRSVQPAQQTADASPDSTNPPPRDSVAAAPRLVPAPANRRSTRASSRGTNRTQSLGSLSHPTSLPPRRRAALRRSGNRDQDVGPTASPMQPTPAQPPAPTSSGPSNARQPLSRREPPSQYVFHGEPVAREAFLGSSLQSSSGGHIFASLQQQGVIVAPDSVWRKQVAAAEAEAGARQLERMAKKNKNKSGKSGKKIRTNQKRPGDTVSQSDKPAKKPRTDEQVLQASKEDHDGKDASGERQQPENEDQVVDAETGNDADGAQEELSDDEGANAHE